MSDTQVLIAGAGPTGLVLALYLTKAGARVRVIDRTTGPGTTSRALVVHTRTLEFYRQIGLADAAVDRGVTFRAVNLWVRGRKAARAPFGEMGVGLSPYPYMLILPQDEHERLLIEELGRLGVTVERQTELISFTEAGGRILARLRMPNGAAQTCVADYLGGCDGARSTVREQLGIGFPGGTYAHVFYVADTEANGPVLDGELHIALDDADFLGGFPMKGQGRMRFVGTVRDGTGASREPSWEDVDRRMAQQLRLDVTKVRWFSTYHVHHRVAVAFRRGRAFLLGDAAHIHSPVGGQGMNTGIGDAVNLAWKLAAVLRGCADAAVLDTYEPERIGFARRLVATTDRSFVFVSRTGRLAGLVRTRVMAPVAWLLTRSRRFRRLMYRTMSQIGIEYRASALSAGAAGRIRGGDRLPWVQPDRPGGADNFAPLTSRDWQLHVYGEPAPAVREISRTSGVLLHSFAWSSAARRTGLRRNATYLVRPDGYVGCADPGSDAAAIQRYLRDRPLVMAARR
jgi:2-polyprenyl-6-methoxyphenol hydroxylase-like FAD-dependent oxidoreductase